MTQSELTKKYLELCEGFYVEPIKNYKKIIENYYKDNSEEKYSKDEIRTDIIKAYLRICEDLNSKPTECINDLPTYKIDNYRIAVINNAIEKEFGFLLKAIAKVSNEQEIRAKRIKTCIAALYDQNIYVNKQSAKILFECENDILEFESAYEYLGGKEHIDLKNYCPSEDENKEEEVED